MPRAAAPWPPRTRAWADAGSACGSSGKRTTVSLPGDPRGSFFWTDGQTVDVASISNFNNGVAVQKFTNKTSTGANGSDLEFPDTDFPMFRLGDAYLIYAEAHLRGGGGDRAQALAYVNALRQRAYGDASGNITDPELTLQFILDERGRELLWEATPPDGSGPLRPVYRRRLLCGNGRAARWPARRPSRSGISTRYPLRSSPPTPT